MGRNPTTDFSAGEALPFLASYSKKAGTGRCHRPNKEGAIEV
jgi:hypothetical protein